MKPTPLCLLFLFILALLSCSDDSLTVAHADIPTIQKISDSLKFISREKHYGVSLINNPVRGTAYVDSIGNEYLFTSIRVVIVNDTVLPINIQVELPDTAIAFTKSGDVTFRTFILQDTINRFGKALKQFLNSKSKKNNPFHKNLQPQEMCSLNIGLLFSSKLGNPFGIIRSQLFFNNQPNYLNIPESMLPAKSERDNETLILLGTSFAGKSTYYSVISSGKIVYLK